MSNTHYRKKDEIKFSICNKLISRGIVGSSSYIYEKMGIGNIDATNINSIEYDEDDVVGVSVNGNRAGAIHVNRALLRRAIQAGARIVTDNSTNRERAYNTGERDVAKFLRENGCEILEESQFRCVWGNPELYPND